MKITNISVAGYKNIFNLNYELSDFNLIIGPNNSGKSNLLEIFWFLNVLLVGSEEVKNNLLNLAQGLKGDIIKSESQVVKIEIEFKKEINGETYKFIYCIDSLIKKFGNGKGGIVKEEFKYKKIGTSGPIATVFTRNEDSIVIKGSKAQNLHEIDESEALLSLITKLKDVKNGFNNVVQSGIDSVLMLTKIPVLYSSPDIIRESIMTKREVIKNGRIVSLSILDEFKSILESDESQYFREILENILNITDLEPVKLENRFIELFITINGNRSRIQQLSDGTLIAINLIIYLMKTTFPVICIEEIENSIHPRLLQELITLIKNDFDNIQVIITTHSPILLNIVQPKDVSILSKNKEGEASLENVKSNKELMNILKDPFTDFGDIFNLMDV